MRARLVCLIYGSSHCLQLNLQLSKGELLDDKLKSLLDISVDDCTPNYLEEEEFFRRFKEDWTLD